MKTSGSCGARAYDCRCGLFAGHRSGLHACFVPGCAALWHGNPTANDFRPVSLPTWPERRLHLVQNTDAA